MKSSLKLIETREQLDPRHEIEPQTLALAKRNAFPVVAQRAGQRDGIGLAVGVAGALLVGGATYLTLSGHRAAELHKPITMEASTTTRPVSAAVPAQASPQLSATGPVNSAPPMLEPTPAREPMINPQLAPNAMPANQAAPTLVVDNSGVAAAPSTSSPPSAPDRSLNEDQFVTPFGGAGPDVASATRMINPSETIAQGTLIAAVLETSINSDLPGYVRAVVSSDVRSFDGSRVLVPRSSRLIGQYKSDIAGGQTRAYVLWTRLIRPDGVSVQLASPAVDYAGQTGLGGSVDNHFLLRFGSALLLSVVGTAATIASGGSALVLSGGQNAASVAAQRGGQIPPTIRVRQGQPIRVFTAKDLDFSTVSGTAG